MRAKRSRLAARRGRARVRAALLAAKERRRPRRLAGTSRNTLQRQQPSR